MISYLNITLLMDVDFKHPTFHNIWLLQRQQRLQTHKHNVELKIFLLCICSTSFRVYRRHQCQKWRACHSPWDGCSPEGVGTGLGWPGGPSDSRRRWWTSCWRLGWGRSAGGTRSFSPGETHCRWRRCRCPFQGRDTGVPRTPWWRSEGEPASRRWRSPRLRRRPPVGPNSGLPTCCWAGCEAWGADWLQT